MKHGQEFRLVGTATVGPKGQVVIPAEVRETMGIAPGDKLIAIHISPKNAICFITEEHAQHLVDKLGAQVAGMKNALRNNK
jgi:AbrB family looped-hinge helix DNA binding protein